MGGTRRNIGRKKPKLMHQARAILKSAQQAKKRKKIEKQQQNKRDKQIAKNRQNLAHKLTLYNQHQEILLIGEGNFSFAQSLVKHVLNGQGKRVVATAYDRHDVLKLKYSDAEQHMRSIHASGALVLLSVDGTELQSVEPIKGRRFDRIVWNFPHTGSGIKDTKKNVMDNQKLLVKFLVSAADCLTADGQIHITLKRGEPYTQWQLVSLATKSGIGLKFVNAVEFVPAMYPGYVHRRTIGHRDGVESKGQGKQSESKEKEASSADDNEFLKGGATTYMFCLDPDAEETDSEEEEEEEEEAAAAREEEEEEDEEEDQDEDDSS